MEPLRNRLAIKLTIQMERLLNKSATKPITQMERLLSKLAIKPIIQTELLPSKLAIKPIIQMGRPVKQLEIRLTAIEVLSYKEYKKTTLVVFFIGRGERI